MITGALIASPAVAQSSTPAAAGSAKSAGAEKPVPPNTQPSNAAKTPAKGLGEHDKKKKQKIVRAVVNADGTLVAKQSFGAESATNLGTVGIYQVCFKVPISNGTYTASIGLPGNTGAPSPGEITVVGRIETDNCLYIQTFDSQGELTDQGFHVTVAYSEKRKH